MKNILKKTASWLTGIAAAAMLTTAPVVAQDASTWEQIQESGKLRIGVTQAPPWFSKNPATGEWDSGLGITVGQKMAETLGVDLEVVEVTWGTAVAALQSNKIDAMPVLDPKPDRAVSVAFPASPLLYISLAVLANDDLAASTWAELNNADVSIAVPQGSSMDTYVTNNLPNADIQRFPDNGASIAAFQSGRVDAVSLFHPPLLAARKKLGRGQLVIPTPAFSSPTSVAVRQESDQRFVNWVSTSISYWYETGQTQGWYADFLTDFGLDPKASPVIQRELLFNK
ncbi:transporter substrate-binding domain-containing protein [Shimia sp.]|uniref:transporter substrate-binding domain-containing protein n=1 Tax=Shimia sp. TaxID=1954381 RepID=UPI0032990F1E